MNVKQEIEKRMDDLELVDPELILSHQALTTVDNPTNADIQEMLVNVQSHLTQVDKNHTIGLRHIRFVHQEHIEQVKKIMNMFAQRDKQIKELERVTESETFNSRMTSLLIKQKQLIEMIDNIK